jgi:LmbE family N-acetylglucosaminyl deacetylase
MSEKARRTILFSFAHPDDESFSGAGTAMKYAAAGARIVLVTATLGERGRAGHPPVCEPGELGACRERELREAAAIIGFDELHLLGFRDRELSDVDPDAVRQPLVGLIRRLRPSVVITFDPNGFNQHPDHVAISRFTADAIAAAADARWFAGTGAPFSVPRVLWTPLLAPWEAVEEPSLEEHPAVDFSIDVSAWRERRLAALRAHRTQHLSVDKYFFTRPDLDRVVATEIWRQGQGPPLARRPSEDIFETL